MKCNNRTSTRRLQRGIAMITTMMMVSILAILGVAYMSMSATSSRISLRGYQKTQASAAAEAGVHAMFASVTQTLRSGSGTMPTIQSTTLSSTFGGVTNSDGTYSASVISDPNQQTPVIDGNGVTTGYINTYTVTAQGTGTSPDGLANATVRATFTVSERLADLPGHGSSFTFPNAALASNGNILLQGNAKTQAITLHGAGADANGVISNKGNAYSVDGPISVAPASLAATQAALGNSPNCLGNTVTALAAPLAFPDAATVETWKQTWKAESEQTYPAYPGGNIVAGNDSPAVGTLTVPAEINGDLNLPKGTLTLSPDSHATAPYILYVHGNINFPTGNVTLNNSGVLIVCDGVFSMGKNSTYNTTGLTAGGLVSLSTSSNAITIDGGATATIGVCYAVNGGVSVGGNGTLTGSIISGQTGATGGIALAGNPTIIYPGGLNTTFTGLPPADNLAVTQQYTPTSPMNWVQTL